MDTLVQIEFCTQKLKKRNMDKKLEQIDRQKGKNDKQIARKLGYIDRQTVRINKQIES